MNRIAGWAAAVALVAGSGCFFIGSGGSTTGKLTFRWSFAGQTDCNAAGVRDVRITVTSGGTVVAPTVVACDNSAHEVGPLTEGEYRLKLEGLNQEGLPDYEVERTFVVLRGDNTDLGTVDLTLLYGTLLVDWKFDVPGIGMGMETPDCALAGVVDTVVYIDDATTNVLTTDPQLCNSPIEIGNLAVGDYFVSVEAFGSYSNIPFRLYQVYNVPFTVTASLTDLGQLLLSRNDENFGTMAISYTFEGGGTCTSNNVSTVVVEDFQGDITEPVATFEYACPASSSDLTLTVPGDHRVAMRAMSSTGVVWSGSTTVNVAFAQTVNVPVTLRR